MTKRLRFQRDSRGFLSLRREPILSRKRLVLGCENLGLWRFKFADFLFRSLMWLPKGIPMASCPMHPLLRPEFKPDRADTPCAGGEGLIFTHIFAHYIPIPLGFSYSYSARRAVLVLVLDRMNNRVRVRVPFH